MDRKFNGRGKLGIDLQLQHLWPVTGFKHGFEKRSIVSVDIDLEEITRPRALRILQYGYDIGGINQG